MKKFIETTAVIKSVGAMFFAGIILVYTVFGGFFGLTEISFSLVWQALFIAAFAAILHYIIFRANATKKMSSVKKMLVFAIPLYLILAVFAVSFRWFAVENPTTWAIFSGLYCVYSGIIAVVFKLYFNITGHKYAQMLSAYQSTIANTSSDSEK